MRLNENVARVGAMCYRGLLPGVMPGSRPSVAIEDFLGRMSEGRRAEIFMQRRTGQRKRHDSQGLIVGVVLCARAIESRGTAAGNFYDDLFEGDFGVAVRVGRTGKRTWVISRRRRGEARDGGWRVASFCPDAFLDAAGFACAEVGGAFFSDADELAAAAFGAAG